MCHSENRYGDKQNKNRWMFVDYGHFSENRCHMFIYITSVVLAKLYTGKCATWRHQILALGEYRVMSIKGSLLPLALTSRIKSLHSAFVIIPLTNA